MTAIVISDGESGWVQALVQALERGAGSAALGDEALIDKAAEGRRGNALLLSWALFGAHPLANRMGMERKCARAQVCQAMVAALGRGVRMFHGDLGHLLQRYPVSVFRVLIAGAPTEGQRRRRLFGMETGNPSFYDMYLPGRGSSVEKAARAILERSAVALGDPGRPMPEDRLRLAADMAEAELDLIRRGVDVEFWGPSGELTLWNHSTMENADLAERVTRTYALRAAVCRRGVSPSLFEKRVPYTVRMRVEGALPLEDTLASVAERNGARLGAAVRDVVVHGGLGWEGHLVVDLPETLADPEEAVWRVRALYPGRRLIVPAPRFAWLVERMGLERKVPMNSGVVGR